jgi:hypothetical protein
VQQWKKSVYGEGECKLWRRMEGHSRRRLEEWKGSVIGEKWWTLKVMEERGKLYNVDYKSWMRVECRRRM